LFASKNLLLQSESQTTWISDDSRCFVGLI